VPVDLDDVLRLAHHLLCAAVVAHLDRDALLDPGSTAIDALAASPEGLRVAVLVESRREELEVAVRDAGELEAPERVAIWSHAMAAEARDAASPLRALLTAREFALLRALMRHPGITLTRQQLREHAWPDVPEVTPNTVDVYVGYLRRKLGADIVRTVRGVGYKLDPDAADALR
jgi:DNA-binding response OmpR family regulator